MSKPLTPSFLDSLRKNGTFGGKALRLVEAETLAQLSSEIETLRALVLRLVPENWTEDEAAREAVGHLARCDVPEAKDLLASSVEKITFTFAPFSEFVGKLKVGTPSGISLTPSGSLQSPTPTLYELKDRALSILDRRTPKTSQQIAVELGSPDRVDLLAALSQLCADGMAIREPGTGVYLARTNPCA